MATLHRAAPILPVRDLARSSAFYRGLGFAVREYEGDGGGAGYGFVTRDGVEVHLGVIADLVRTAAKHSAYLRVDDAEALAAEWRGAGAEVHGPEDTPWGQHEGAVVDPDGNVFRFGAPMR